jgi:hypothetical protein
MGLMPDRKGKGLDLQEVRITQQAIDIDAQRMCCQLGVQPGTQAPKGMGMIDLNAELVGLGLLNPFSTQDATCLGFGGFSGTFPGTSNRRLTPRLVLQRDFLWYTSLQ